MFAFLVGLVKALVVAVGFWGAVSIATAAVALIAVNWEKWGKDLVMAIGAVVFIATAIYLGVALLTNALVVTELDIIFNVLLLTVSGVVGWDLILDMIKDVASLVIEILREVAEAVIDVASSILDQFPLLKAGLYAGGAYLIYDTFVSDDEPEYRETTIVAPAVPAYSDRPVEVSQ